jgi:myo-inositol-1(or 4)-monophosphatase
MISPVLRIATASARDAYQQARASYGRDALLEAVAAGADGTPTTRLDELVETAILRAVEPFGVDIVSEECGFIDNGGPFALVIDPVDGTGNAAAGIPVSAFTAALAEDGEFVEAITCWLETGQTWWARHDTPATMTTTGRRSLDGALVSMIRPKGDGRAFLAVAERADRIRVFGSSSLEAAWVGAGALDAFLDPGSDTHRIVDLAAATVIVRGAGGDVRDLHGRPLGFTTAISGRWSGVVAASPELADELVDVVTSALDLSAV